MSLKKHVNKLLGEILIERKILSPEQLQQVLSIQKESGRLLGEIVVQLGIAKEEDIAQALTAQYGFPFLPLDNYEIDPETIKLIPREKAFQYLCVPVDRLGNNLSIALANPLNSQAAEEIEQLTGLKLQIFVTTASDIRRAIEKYYKPETRNQSTETR